MVTAVWTGVGAEPDHAGPPRLSQQLREPGVQLSQEVQVQDAAHILLALQGPGYSTWLSLLSPTVWCSRLFGTAMEMGFPQRLKVVSWEQRLREGRRALNWVSMMPHSFRSRSCRVAEVHSIRTCRGSKLRLVRLTPLRLRSFSMLMLGHCDRYIRSDSESRQLVIHKVSRGVFRHLARDRAVSPRVGGGGQRNWGGEACFTGTQGISLA